MLLTSLFFVNIVSAGEVVFEGYPSTRSDIREALNLTYELSDDKAPMFKVVIEREGDKYYWRTNNDYQLVPIKSEKYVTYLALNGSGYIRILSDAMREKFRIQPDSEKDDNYIYMEHKVYKMGANIFYGR